MVEEPNIEIQFLRQTDLAEAIQLEESERWNQTEADWKRVQRLCPEGCFAAFCQGSLVGTVTTINYQQKLAWLGMMLVKQEHRGRGIGKRLMSASLNYCKQAGIETIKLDATPAGEPLYASFGFRSEAIVERWEGIPRLVPREDVGWLGSTILCGRSCMNSTSKRLAQIEDNYSTV